MKRWIAVGVAIVVAIPTATIMALGYRFQPKGARESPAEVQREIVALTATRDSLRTLVYDAAATSDLLDRRPPGDIAIALPTPFVDAIVQSVIAGWFHDVELRLPRMHLHTDGTITARLSILGRRTVGAYGVDVTLDNVHGRLQPGAPKLTFGGDTIRIVVPVRIAGGTGTAHVTARWESRGLAGPVCGDMTATHDVTGQVRANTYVARGRLVLNSVDGTVHADPAFPDLAIRLFIDPAPQSVAALDSVLATRGGLCKFAIDKAHASERIQEIVGRGFKITIPQRFFRPIQLPVSVETSVPVADRTLSLRVLPSRLNVTSSTVWIAADVALQPRTTPMPPSVQRR
jgi:hypothetical protein